MTDQTTPATTMSTLADHVVVTNTVVEQLAGHGREVPRYIADEIGQAVLALVPDEPAELTPVQSALLDALRDVALDPDAPTSTYAGKELVRLTVDAFGNPIPKPEVVRQGGLADIWFGRPVRADQLATGGPIPDPRRPMGTGLGAEPLAVVVDELHQPEGGELGLEQPTSGQIATETEGWPFKPGDVVLDSGEEADHGAWVGAAPDGVILSDHAGDRWKRDESGWWCTRNEPTSVRLNSHDLHTSWGPLTVVSVPDQETSRG